MADFEWIVQCNHNRRRALEAAEREEERWQLAEANEIRRQNLIRRCRMLERSADIFGGCAITITLIMALAGLAFGPLLGALVSVGLLSAGRAFREIREEAAG